MFDEDGYVRKPGKSQRPKAYQFINPYPQMSEPEARVFLFLQGLGVPFSWREFDGKTQAPQFTALMPSYVPEFTLTEYKIVILVVGSYWGSIPGILENTLIAQVLLEQDGWKVGLLQEQDIRTDVAKAVLAQLPQLNTPVIRGGPKNFPESYDKAYMERRRQNAKSIGFRMKKPFSEDANWDDWDGKRKPKRGDRRRSARIERETKPYESYNVGASRLTGTFSFNFKKSRYTSARTTKYSEPLYRKQPEKGQQ
jgi:G:T-mismatch repair DNA endonuclease (very short patch repair protein)